MNTISLKGRRLPDTDDLDSVLESMQPGDYIKYKSGWWCILPNKDFCNISTWAIVENDDSSITVSPSINSIHKDDNGWHGHIINGEFKSC